MLVNFTSGIGIVDAGIGGVATLMSCLIMWLMPFVLPSIIFVVAINGFAVGAELYYFMNEPFWFSSGMVMLGEFVVLIIGYIFLLVFKKKNRLPTAQKLYGNIDFKW